MKEHDRKVVFSRKSDEYATPQEFYDILNTEFGFTLDPAANPDNHKCENYFTQEIDGLLVSWKTSGAVFCNPPYSSVAKWIKKGYNESQSNFINVVMLVPSRTDTKWFHEYCMKATEIRFVKGRLKFGDEKNAAPFPSMIVVFKPGGTAGGPRISTMSRK